MIRYRLICDNNHEYEAWFQNSAAFDKQVEAGLLECVYCGSKNVKKGLMAPNITAKANTQPEQSVSQPNDAKRKEIVETIKKVRKKIEKNADYVGDRFAEEARKIYYKESEERGIYGEASLKDVKELDQEGIPLVPLPSLPEDQN